MHADVYFRLRKELKNRMSLFFILPFWYIYIYIYQKGNMKKSDMRFFNSFLNRKYTSACIYVLIKYNI